MPITNPNDLKADVNLLTSYFPKFMNKKKTDNKTFNKYVKINIGHSVEILDLIGDLGTWFQNGEHAMYVDMLQCERSKEAGFLTNSYFTMDLEVLREYLEDVLGCKVGLRWKPIAGTFDKTGDPVRAIHIEVNQKGYHKTLRDLSDMFGQGKSGFDGGRKMRFSRAYQILKVRLQGQ